MQNEAFEFIDKAVNGDKKALGNRLISVKNMVYNLSLRMLGSPHDAEDAVQEIMIKCNKSIFAQCLSHIRKKMAEFFCQYCRLFKTGKCSCKKRVGYSIQTHRLNPKKLEYSNLVKLGGTDTLAFTEAMEEMDRLFDIFAQLHKYRSPLDTKNFMEKLLASNSMNVIKVEV